MYPAPESSSEVIPDRRVIDNANPRNLQGPLLRIATSGQATAEPPMTLMKSRRRTSYLLRGVWDDASYGPDFSRTNQSIGFKMLDNVRLVINRHVPRCTSPCLLCTKSDIKRASMECPLRAKSGHSCPNKFDCVAREIGERSAQRELPRDFIDHS